MAKGTVFTALYYADKSRNKNTSDADKIVIGQKKNTSAKSYIEILENVRSSISKNHAGELANVIAEDDGRKVLKNLISKYIHQNDLTCSEIEDYNDLIEKIFEDMAGFGFLTKYIYSEDVEEININAWNDVEVIDNLCGNQPYRKLDEHFNTPQQCIDMIKKMCALGGIVIDGSQPVKDSYIFKGVRISAMISPIVDDEVGASASIRRQKTNMITRQQLIDYGTATSDELDFLNMCLAYGISVAIGGSTGSGKTTDLGYLLRNIPDNKRIYTIEDSRELNLIKQNESGKTINRVIHTLTRVTDDPKTNISANHLLKQALRQHPDVIVPAEMRGVEAWAAQEAGRTGHTIATTLHCNSAATAYLRILTMCQEADTKLSEELIMTMIMEAFPIVVFKKQLQDKSRKYMEIIEPTGYTDGRLKYNTLFRFVTKGWEKDDAGKLKVLGEHQKVMPLSGKLAKRMLENGASIDEVKRFAGDNWKPEDMEV